VTELSLLFPFAVEPPFWNRYRFVYGLKPPFNIHVMFLTASVQLQKMIGMNRVGKGRLKGTFLLSSYLLQPQNK